MTCLPLVQHFLRGGCRRGGIWGVALSFFPTKKGGLTNASSGKEKNPADRHRALLCNVACFLRPFHRADHDAGQRAQRGSVQIRLFVSHGTVCRPGRVRGPGERCRIGLRQVPQAPAAITPPSLRVLHGHLHDLAGVLLRRVLQPQVAQCRGLHRRPDSHGLRSTDVLYPVVVHPDDLYRRNDPLRHVPLHQVVKCPALDRRPG